MQREGRIGSYGIVLVKISHKSTRCACNAIPCWRICQKSMKEMTFKCGWMVKINHLIQNLYGVIF